MFICCYSHNNLHEQLSQYFYAHKRELNMVNYQTKQKKKAEKILELIDLVLKKCDRHFPNDHVDTVLELV